MPVPFFHPVRLLAKKKVAHGSLTALCLAGVGLLYFCSAATYLFVGFCKKAFRKEEVDENAFNLYKNEGWFFRNSFLTYVPIATYYFIFNTIIMSEILDNIPYISRKIANDLGKVDRKKMVMFRCLIMFVMVLIALSTDNVIAVLDIAGTVFSPLGSFLIPVRKAD